jgi:hypothetical protein
MMRASSDLRSSKVTSDRTRQDRFVESRGRTFSEPTRSFCVAPRSQPTSRALIEEVQFTETRVTSLDWKSYPVLRFADHPNVTPIVVRRLNDRSTGAGEEVMGAAVGAIANAFFDATGARTREYPMTPDRVRATLEA